MKKQEADELKKSLLALGISEEEINDSLKKSETEPEDKTKEEPKKEPEGKPEDEKDDLDEQIKKKEEELASLKKSKASKKSIKKSLRKALKDDFNRIEKSFTNEGKNLNNKFSDLVTLVKGLTENVIILKEDNAKIVKENEELRKAFEGSEEILKKLAQFSPGLRSSAKMPLNFTPRFEKSEDGKQIYSVTGQKDEIVGMLSKKMDDQKFAQSFGQEVASFEISSRLSPRLQKAIEDEFGVKLTQ
jgi:dGTP triphosphohydrolase